MSRSWATRPGTLFWCWWFSGARWIVLHLQESLVVTLSFCLLPFMEGFAGHLRAWESALACAWVSGVTVDFCHREAWSLCHKGRDGAPLESDCHWWNKWILARGRDSFPCVVSTGHSTNTGLILGWDGIRGARALPLLLLRVRMLLADAVVCAVIWLAAVFNIHEEHWRKRLPCLFSIKLLEAYMEHWFLLVLWFQMLLFCYYKMVQVFVTTLTIQKEDLGFFCVKSIIAAVREKTGKEN